MPSTRSAIVTGVSRKQSIGAAIAHALAEDSFSLFLVFNRASDAATGLAEHEQEPETVFDKLAKSRAVLETLEIDLGDPTAPACVRYFKNL